MVADLEKENSGPCGSPLSGFSLVVEWTRLQCRSDHQRLFAVVFAVFGNDFRPALRWAACSTTRLNETRLVHDLTPFLFGHVLSIARLAFTAILPTPSSPSHSKSLTQRITWRGSCRRLWIVQSTASPESLPLSRLASFLAPARFRWG